MSILFNRRHWITPGGAAYPLFREMLQQPHLLIAGCTGSGKSVLLADLLYQITAASPARAALILIDPKRVELARFRQLPHVIGYANEPGEAVQQLRQAERIMMQRYADLERVGGVETSERDIYVIIDELADLLLAARRDVLPLMQRIAQLGRATHVHLIAATQSPSRKTLPAEITLNIPARVALRCQTAIESRQIIGANGAELLPRCGSLIYSSPDGCGRWDGIPYMPEAVAERVRWWTPSGQRAAWREMKTNKAKGDI